MKFRPSMRLLAAMTAVVTALVACSSPTSPTAQSAPTTKVTLGFSAWPGWFPLAGRRGAGPVRQERRRRRAEVLRRLHRLASTRWRPAARRQQPDAQRHPVSRQRRAPSRRSSLVNDNSTGNDQIIATRASTRSPTSRARRSPPSRAWSTTSCCCWGWPKAGLTEKDINFRRCPPTPRRPRSPPARSTRRRVRPVHHHRARRGRAARPIAPRSEFPGAIPDHLVVTAALAKDTRPRSRRWCNTWYDTLDWIKANKDEAIEIMAKRAGVTPSDYRTYDAGTTIFTRQQNLDAFASGTTPAQPGLPGGQDRRLPGEHRPRQGTSLDWLDCSTTDSSRRCPREAGGRRQRASGADHDQRHSAQLRRRPVRAAGMAAVAAPSGAGRTSSLFAIRTPISPAARWTLTTLSLAIPLLAWVVLSASKVVSARLPAVAGSRAVGRMGHGPLG